MRYRTRTSTVAGLLVLLPALGHGPAARGSDPSWRVWWEREWVALSQPRAHELPLAALHRLAGEALLRACEDPDPEVAAWARIGGTGLVWEDASAGIAADLESDAAPVARAAVLASGLSLDSPGGNAPLGEDGLRRVLLGEADAAPASGEAGRVLAAFALGASFAGEARESAAALASVLDAPASDELHGMCVRAIAGSLDSYPGRLESPTSGYPERLATPGDAVRWLAACLADESRPAVVRRRRSARWSIAARGRTEVPSRRGSDPCSTRASIRCSPTRPSSRSRACGPAPRTAP